MLDFRFSKVMTGTFQLLVKLGGSVILLGTASFLYETKNMIDPLFAYIGEESPFLKSLPTTKLNTAKTIKVHQPQTLRPFTPGSLLQTQDPCFLYGPLWPSQCEAYHPPPCEGQHPHLP